MGKSMTYEEYEDNNRIVATAKIVTYDGMYYTINKYSNADIESVRLKQTTIDGLACGVVLDDEAIINDLVREDLWNIINTKEDLIFLPYEAKIINRKEIKESLIQFN